MTTAEAASAGRSAGPAAPTAAMSDSDRAKVRMASAMVASSSVRHVGTYDDPGTCPRTVREALAAMLPAVDDAGWRARLELADVFVNGRPVAGEIAAAPLEAPCRVEFFEPRCGLGEVRAAYPPFGAGNVVFRDDALAVLFKPAGLPTTEPKEQKLYSLRRLGAAVLGVSDVHVPSRLDLGVQGLVPVSVRRSAHHALQSLFQRRTVRKCYLLECAAPHGRGRARWDAGGGDTVRVDRGIGRDPRHTVLRRLDDEGGQPAQTDFTLVGRGSVRALGGDGAAVPTLVLLAEPRTGRTHQIRLHAAALGLPLVNDVLYDGVPVTEPGAGRYLASRNPLMPDCGGLRLMCYALSMPHPATGEPLTVTVPPRLLPAWAGAVSADAAAVVARRLAEHAAAEPARPDGAPPPQQAESKRARRRRRAEARAAENARQRAARQ